VPADNGAPPVYKKKTYDSYIIDAPAGGRGRPREADPGHEALKTGKAIAKEIALSRDKNHQLACRGMPDLPERQKVLEPLGWQSTREPDNWARFSNP